MRRTIAGLALAAASALAAAGCGDDAPSKQEFAQQANEVCRDIERQGGRLGDAQPRSLDDLVAFSERAERNVADGVKRLRALERPSGEDGELAKRFVDALGAELDAEFVPALRRLRTAARQRDPRGLRVAAERLQQVDTTRSAGLARELGAIACAD